MRLVRVEEAREGDRIGKDVVAPDGRLILRKGMIVTGWLIDGFKRMQIDEIYIEDERTTEIQIANGTGLQFRMQAVSVLNTIFTEVTEGKSFSSKPLLDTNDDMVRHLSAVRDPWIQIKNIRTRTGFLMDHSVNVAMLSVLTAKALGYNPQQLRVVGLGALLHDIGYAIPGLKNREKEHPKAGFELIRKNPEIPLMSAHLVLQHHEKVNGQGYPYGIKGKDVREMAQICAIANDFDNYVNEIDKNRLPHEGIEYIMSKVDIAYDFHIVQTFVRNVVPYPIGTIVRLTTGISGVVTEVNKANASRPVIRELNGERTISLFEEHTVFITEVLSSRDIYSS